MTLKQLEAFYWAATCASFSIAAERLHLSTSSLSKRLAELEQSLDVLLFNRTAHKATLTEAGKNLLPHAEALLLSAEETKKAVRPLSKITGRCIFGIGELSALTWLPRLANRVHERYPGLTFEPLVDIGTSLDAGLSSGAVDCAVVAGRASRPTIVSHTIGQAHFVWAGSPELITHRSSGNADLFKRYPVVTLPTGAGTSVILDEWLMRHDIDLRHRLICNSWGATASLLMEGLGIGILPESWAQSLERRGHLQILSSMSPLSPLTYTFQHRRNDGRPVVEAMLEAVRQTVDFSVSPRLL